MEKGKLPPTMERLLIRQAITKKEMDFVIGNAKDLVKHDMCMKMADFIYDRAIIKEDEAYKIDDFDVDKSAFRKGDKILTLECYIQFE